MKWWMLLLPLAACGGDKDSGDDGPPSGGPTFYQDVLPVIGENCQQCHNSSKPMGGAFALETYEQVAAFAPVLLKKMSPDGDTQDPFFMPPFNARASEDCTPPHEFRGNYQVELEEYTVFSDWIAAGKPRGDEADPAPFTVPPVVGLTGDNVYPMTFAGEYTVPDPEEGGYDSLRCFAMQFEDESVALAADLWIDGMEFNPGNPSVAHHMLLYSVPDLEAHMLAGLVEDSDTNSWACSGGVNRSDGAYSVNDISLMWGWVPGGLPLELESDMALRLSARTGLVVQLHYNTLSNPEVLEDLSELGIRVRQEVPQREAFFELFGVAGQGQTDAVDNPPFEVPLGAVAHVESYTERYPELNRELRLWGFVPHMHLAGTALDLRLGGDDGETCLVNIPRYDYNWQQMYQYDSGWEGLPVLSRDNSLSVRCTYDNSEGNVMLQKYLGGPVSGGVRLGEETSDEMCLVGVGLACDGLCQ